ncbi:MAG: preprotein translocase subunit YajC [Flavobacteriales bacterium]|jgi:preprotein translocase subunit YajC|nr:preprotein translocase subunit YajC [Flavobacteriales bacterium]|tara:strand:+ start:1952 stop:2257 length:306 start_codon:yes stop_codon:yes gene_type:complete
MQQLFIILQSPPSSGFASFLPFILIMVVFYFFMIRPQINKQRADQKFQTELKKGDKIVTIGGIYGKIIGVKEDKIILEINENTKMTIERNSISREKSMIRS